MMTHPRFLALLPAGIAFTFAVACMAHCVSGQQRFLLQSIDPPVESAALLESDRLSIYPSEGGAVVYDRDDRFDSANGKFLGFSNRRSRQAIRWPIDHAGGLQIGQLDGRGEIQFRASQMRIVAPNAVDGINDPRARSSEPLRTRDGDARDGDEGILPDAWMQQSIPVLLANEPQGLQYLNRQTRGFTLTPDPNSGWFIVPVGQDLVRLQSRQGDTYFGLGCDVVRRRPDFTVAHAGPEQLWRVNMGVGGGYVFESVALPGQVLAWQQNQLLLQPLGFSQPQLWYPSFPRLPMNVPLIRSVNTEAIPNAPLAPAEIALQNPSQNAVWILLTDRRSGREPQKIRIESNSQKVVRLERDSGAMLVESFEQQMLDGRWQSERYRTPIPPAILYDISVYEEILQSIAIDATKAGGNRIMDTNFQPKSIGFFVIPPGDAVSQRGAINVVGKAKAARNPGGVRRMDPEALGYGPTKRDPLKDLLIELQTKRSAF
jgi:hypothetical protein